MASASFLGYGNQNPMTVSHLTGFFNDNTIPTRCMHGGLKGKIKNITKMYKMKGQKKNTMRNRIRKLSASRKNKIMRSYKSRKSSRNRTRRVMRGGAGENWPTGYGLNSKLDASSSALANPLPATPYFNSFNNMYNHFTGVTN